VRRAVLAASRGDAARSSLRARIGVDEKRTLVVVTGGSLGAGSLNEAALGLAGLWADRSDIAIYHLAGERNLEEMKELAALAGVTGLSRGSLQYRLAGYDPALPQALAAADLVVSRAGASTVAELTAIGVPSILVPLPRAPSDHQAKNAEKLARRGAAVVLPDERLSAEALAGEISALSAGGRLAEMAEAAAALGRPEAADEVAAMAIDAAGGRRSPE
jgi:UDP-N-acetylglucosamine--N-acetylmuramyl-(pentapeptide) pyrophosphoryl-undecaprenol N-acetylglucosamine transferase